MANVEVTTKRKAEDENRELSEKKSRAEEEPKGIKREFDDWEQTAKSIKENVENKAAERSTPEAGRGSGSTT